LAIPDNTPAGVSDTLSVTELVSITDLNVSIQATHPYVGDLGFTLEHQQSGIQVTLLDRPGVPESQFGCPGRNIDAQFNDEAITAAETTCQTDPALAGQLQPQEPLAAFEGESLWGEWVLTASDHATLDNGTLVEWCLLAETVEQSLCDSVSQIPAAECEALVSFYEETKGTTWHSQDDWLATNTPCSWFGLSCTGSHVTQLELPANNLNGPLPAVVGDLTNLSSLVISGNELDGSLPLSLSGLDLQTFWYEDTNLCEPVNPVFQAWLESIPNLRALNQPCQRVYLPITR
jgi:subtilisin-like proprotein convertase family protein